MKYFCVVKQPEAVATFWGKTNKKIFTMNIQDIICKGSNISVSVEVDDLLKFANLLIEKTKRELEETIKTEKIEKQLSPKEVSGMLGVDLSTLWRWQKRGYLVPVEVGGKRRYKMSDVKSLLDGGRKKI